ncbi:MAG: hypothetical protein PHX04_06260 [Bacilli bacterium]|nr:hypothetical protein [Bacilli bacterium]
MNDFNIEPLMIHKAKCKKNVKLFKNQFITFGKDVKYEYSKYRILDVEKVRVWADPFNSVDISLSQFEDFFKVKV